MEDKQTAIQVGLISASAIGGMKALDYMGLESFYQSYHWILLVIFILLIIFSGKIARLF